MHRSRLIGVAAACLLALAGCGGTTTPHHSVPATSTASAMGSVRPAGWGLLPNGAVSLPRAAAPGAQTREMFDTIGLSALTGLRPIALAGYTAGFWPTYLPLTRAYPHAIVKSIAIGAGWHAMCLDIEPGDATPAQAPGWWRADRAAGFAKPCLYSSFSEWSQVRAALNAAGIARSSYWAWDADYFGSTPRLDLGFDATQWTDHAYGRNLDESTATLAFLGIEPTWCSPVWGLPCPTPKPKPRPKPEPRCYQKRESAKACAAAKAKVASDNRAAIASRSALVGVLHTERILRQRVRWFTAAERRLIAAN